MAQGGTLHAVTQSQGRRHGQAVATTNHTTESIHKAAFGPFRLSLSASPFPLASSTTCPMLTTEEGRPPKSPAMDTAQAKDTVDSMLENPPLILELMKAVASFISVGQKQASGYPFLSQSLSKMASECDSAISMLQEYMPPHLMVALQTPPDSTSPTPGAPGPPRIPMLDLLPPLRLSIGQFDTEEPAPYNGSRDSGSHNLGSTSQLSTATRPVEFPGDKEPRLTQNQPGEECQTIEQASHTVIPFLEGGWLSTPSDDEIVRELSRFPLASSSRSEETSSQPPTTCIPFPECLGTVFTPTTGNGDLLEGYSSSFHTNGTDQSGMFFGAQILEEQLQALCRTDPGQHESFLECTTPVSPCQQHGTSTPIRPGLEGATGGCLTNSYAPPTMPLEPMTLLSEANLLTSAAPDTCCPADLTVVPPDPEADLANAAVSTTETGDTETASTCVSADAEEQANLSQTRQGDTRADFSATETATKRKRPSDRDDPFPKRRKVQLEAVEVKLTVDAPSYLLGADHCSWVHETTGESSVVAFNDLQETSRVGVRVCDVQSDQEDQTIWLYHDDGRKNWKWRGTGEGGRSLGVAKVTLSCLVQKPGRGPFEGTYLS
ncbi:uncharacterized protein F5Z01DRAFT_698466 [Emericellopsis atlantica]|uniref:Uncharacterized protein n=1 Tax=Emericellopsis atlantica TaxID=2614577 RepID=A0A9P8CLA0_9HYPO|nr:uncharacterized protein F5Z01DRAFT_698466 [Emericellopsis atlantica]KAG9249406.1 hypothetical protein F5Z01DRAFT_698466 [Emericellopsis atlantica]